MLVQKRIDAALRRAALYARVSTEEQAMHGVSLDAQRERLIQYARENGLEITGIYVDEGISARKRYTARPAFMRMLDSVKRREVDVILFIKLDRWFRNIADYYEVQAILDRHRVQWVATEESYDTTTANGRLSLNIKLAIAQDESDRTSERIKFVFRNMVKEGRVISGQTGIGLKIVDKHVVIDENEADIARAVFRHYIDTRSTRAVQRFILEQYHKALDLKTIKRMLRNSMYAGEAYGIENWCPAIIDKETFALANDILKTRAERFDGSRSDRVYLFTGLLYCEACGRRMATYSCQSTRKDGTTLRFIYYRCPGHINHSCTMTKQFNQDKLEAQLLASLSRAAAAYQWEAEEQARQAKRPRGADASKLLAKIDKLKDLYLNDLIPKELYESSYFALSSQLQEILTAESEEEAAPIALPPPSDSLKLYDRLDGHGKKAFWSRSIKEAVMSGTGAFSVRFHQLS